VEDATVVSMITVADLIPPLPPKIYKERRREKRKEME